MSSILDHETVQLTKEGDALRIIDQTLLPAETKYIDLRDGEEMWEAIYALRVRGAPAIGVFAAYAVYLLARTSGADTFKGFYDDFLKQKDYLNSARPTAVNLSWALNRMEKRLTDDFSAAERAAGSAKAAYDRDALLEGLLSEAHTIREEDIDVCRRIGEHGLTLVKPGDGILTHCNAGQLATIRYGTATAPIYLGHEKGYNFRVYCDETRPLLQGARLTAYELVSAGVDTTLICDNMSASVMKKGLINAVFTGCDRVAANGDTANKIGTSVVATVAAHYGVPVYICAPTSTIDLATPTGDQIVIEERPAEEVTEMWYAHRMAPEGVKVFNPSFDVTDASLIAGIVTEYGVLRPPYEDSIGAMFAENGIVR